MVCEMRLRIKRGKKNFETEKVDICNKYNLFSLHSLPLHSQPTLLCDVEEERLERLGDVESEGFVPVWPV